jgi:hypothetical protein
MLNKNIFSVFLKKIDKVKRLFNTNEDSVSNKEIQNKQKILLALIIFGLLIFCVFFIYLFMGKNTHKKETINSNNLLELDLVDKSLDPETHWRNYFEEQRLKDNNLFKDEMNLLKKSHAESIIDLKKSIKQKLSEEEKRRSLTESALKDIQVEIDSLDKKDPSEKELKHLDINIANFNDRSIDIPKSSKEYIPAGTYFTGHLLGGIVVSTALNAPDTNATPVVIRLVDRGNLAQEANIKIKTCKIMGSAYGDISSERAVIRLEKLICKKENSYFTSKISGQVFGDDGFNGIKGTVISTSSKHIKNAMIGGIIDGIVSAIKINPLSSNQKEKQNHDRDIYSDMLGKSMNSGVSSAGEKLTDYYLKQAESMSPVLTIPSGTRVNTQVTEGFYIGQSDTHKK